MTNVSSGVYKRSSDGPGGDRSQAYKRHRGEVQEPKDWRDVHLQPPAKKEPPASSSSSSHAGRDSLESRRGKREDSYKRGSDYRDRERPRDRGGRDQRYRDDDRRKSNSRSRRSNGAPTLPPAVVKEPEEREEGE